MSGGRGPAPKDPATRRRTNVDPNPRATLVDDGVQRGPDLPELPAEMWHERTLAMFETWRTSPQAGAFIATDWDFLIDTCLMHHVMWSKGRWEFAAEVRLRSAKLGATREDRLRLRMDIEPPRAEDDTPDVPAGVTEISSRRARLTS